MANVTRKRTGEFLQKLLKILLANPDGMQAKEALKELEKQVQLTEYEMGEFGSGGRRFEKIVRFATVDAVKAGWMRKNKGIWTVTEGGIEALDKFKDSAQFYQEAVRLYRQWKDTQIDDTGDTEEETIEREVKITYEEAEEQAWREISNYLEKINPYHLQDLTAALLEAMEYHVTWVSPPGKDGGVDLIAYTDPLGTKPPRIKVQVKRRKDNIGVEEIRAFLALINRDDVGLYITTGGFSKDAHEFARNQETRKITLIDMQRLVELWIEYNDKIDSDDFSLLPLEPIYFLKPQN